MKKLALILFAAMLVSLLVLPASATNAFTATYGHPVVDGVKDDCYTGTPIEVKNQLYTVDGDPATGVFYAAWDEENVYFYCEITDDIVAHTEQEILDYVNNPMKGIDGLWSVDSAVIAISFEEGKFGTYEDDYIDGGQFIYGAFFPAFAGKGPHNDEFQTECAGAYRLTDTGFAVEMSIPSGKVLTNGMVLPFCGGLEDNDNPDNMGDRKYEAFSGDPQGQSQCWLQVDESWDSLTLIGKEAETEAPTEETKITAEETSAPTEETEAPSDDPSPVTADIAVIAAGIALAAAAVVVFKKH